MTTMKPIKKKDIKLIQTCGACPEQYDAHYQWEKIWYLRLRHWYFYVEFYDTVVYRAYPKWDWMFEDDEREYYLNKAKKHLRNAYNKSLESIDGWWTE